MKWALYDYGVGNLHSLRKALESAGAAPEITRDPAVLLSAPVAVLPGVGAFGAVMASLHGAVRGLRQRHVDGRPILGVCIGMQALHTASEESPGVRGLGVVPGSVLRLPASAGKVPHMGWNQLEALRGPLFDGVPAGTHAYFVHSYAPPPGEATVATATYGTSFTAALHFRNTVGFQFHPEKSGAAGSRILRNAVAVLEAAA